MTSQYLMRQTRPLLRACREAWRRRGSPLPSCAICPVADICVGRTRRAKRSVAIPHFPVPVRAFRR